MEKEINIAEILKDKRENTELYSPMIGRCLLKKVMRHTTFNIKTEDMNGLVYYFTNLGKFAKNGEIMLFPSKEMRDWSKFTWKKGDVLQSNDNQDKCIFEKFIDDEYETFKAKYYVTEGWKGMEYIENLEPLDTSKYNILPTDSLERLSYINYIEERLGGKLNMENLEIEPSKPKWTPKPFDKVLGRVFNDIWYCDFFSHMNDNIFVCIGEEWDECLPYNEETAKLIGTINDYKEN